MLNKRIRTIREYLKLSRAVFGQRIGVSGDVINNLERGRVEPKESMIKLICTEFGVNEGYLRHGTKPMFIVTPSSVMEQLKKEFNLDDFSYHLVYEYLKLEPAQKNIVNNFLQSIMKEDETAYNDISSETCSVEEAEEAYIKSRSRPVKKTEQFVLNTTDDTAKHDEASQKAANQ